MRSNIFNKASDFWQNITKSADPSETDSLKKGKFGSGAEKLMDIPDHRFVYQADVILPKTFTNVIAAADDHWSQKFYGEETDINDFFNEDRRSVERDSPFNSPRGFQFDVPLVSFTPIGRDTNSLRDGELPSVNNDKEERKSRLSDNESLTGSFSQFFRDDTPHNYENVHNPESLYDFKPLQTEEKTSRVGEDEIMSHANSSGLYLADGEMSSITDQSHETRRRASTANSSFGNKEALINNCDSINRLKRSGSGGSVSAAPTTTTTTDKKTRSPKIQRNTIKKAKKGSIKNSPQSKSEDSSSSVSSLGDLASLSAGEENGIKYCCKFNLCGHNKIASSGDDQKERQLESLFTQMDNMDRLLAEAKMQVLRGLAQQTPTFSA
eukprot:CAMPEP_0115009360 /NCGR_PEP_ID=MMETSP0216-20121206/22561_1 /TAXON_ID=223996 /ORGANISM="Protocruzia adherens, Strain Boccale" /LENGTH=380 /DNA_ID=CAMNT_0002377143 /DNA_START=30 /DNA_END=1172 /DNA_ORIENTATION=+